MAEFVSEPLHVVRFQATGVPNDVEVSWSDSSLTYTLTHQEEIVPTTNRQMTTNSLQHGDNLVGVQDM